MITVPFAILLAAGLFAGMLLVIELGRRIGDRYERDDPEGAHAGTGPVEGAIFALLGLLVAFTFSGAAGRFDQRRHLIVEEANDIGTAYLRLDVLPVDAQAALRELFRRYTDIRIATYRQPSLAAAREQHAQAVALQTEIWERSVAACRDAGSQPCAILILPALNAMFDVVTTRMASLRMHPPLIVFGMLCAIGLACALLAGYSMASGTRRKLTHTITFAAVTALTVYVILDFEYPRVGFIRVDAFDQVLLDVRATMEGK